MRFVLRFVIVLGVTFGPIAWAGTLARFRTVLGEMDVELFDFEKPATVRNFKYYVESGAYTNLFISRWSPNFVIQGGGFSIMDRGATNQSFGLVPLIGPVTNEYSIGQHYSNLYGTIAMARRAGVTNSATSQFFFNLKDNDFLDSVDGGFTVFGQVLTGTNVLNRFKVTSADNGIFRVQVPSVFDELPVLKVPAGYDDLIYMDISLLKVQVARAAEGGQEISWRSVSNRVNQVQVTTNLPPVWHELARTNGTGDRLRIIDAAAAPAGRFYRVVVEY